MSQEFDERRRAGGVGEQLGPGATPGKRTRTESLYPTGRRNDGAPEHADAGPERLPFLDHMISSGAAAPVQMQPAPGSASPPAPRSMAASLKVTAYLANGGVKQESLRDRWDGSPLPVVWKARRVGESWQWSDARAADLRIFTDTPAETLVGDWASKQGAHTVIVHVTDRVVDLDPLDVSDVRGSDRAKFGEQSWKLGDALPDELVGNERAAPVTPQTELEGESSFGTRPMFRPPAEPAEAEGSSQVDGARDGVDGGTGSSSVADASRKGPSQAGTKNGAAVGSPNSRGRSVDAHEEGHSLGDRIGPSGPNTAPIGRKRGPAGGRLGAQVRDKDGSDRGRPDGEGSETSIVHNPLAEKAPGAGGNIPDDGGERDGMHGGTAGKGGGGLPGGGLWKKLLTVPRDIAPVIAAGQILVEADISGVTGKVIKHALVKGATAATVRKAARKEIADYVELEIVKVEQNWSQLAGWAQMTDAERAIAVAQAREAVAERAYREVVAGLDHRIADLEGNLQSLGIVASGDGLADDMIKDAVEYTEIELNAIRKARRALDDFEMPRAGRDAPYSPRKMRDDLEAEYPGDLETATVPYVRPNDAKKGAKRSDKGAKLAGQRHPTTGIPFDERGFPIFDDVARFDTRLPSSASGVADSDLHMETATRQLREAIQRGQVSEARFSAEQLKVIMREKPPAHRVPGYTWHHHQERGRMQLVPTDIHDETGHTGGMKMWFQ